MLESMPDATFRIGRTLATTIYRGDEQQPCAWVPNNTELAALIVELLNSQKKDHAPTHWKIKENIDYEETN